MPKLPCGRFVVGLDVQSFKVRVLFHDLDVEGVGFSSRFHDVDVYASLFFPPFWRSITSWFGFHGSSYGVVVKV